MPTCLCQVSCDVYIEAIKASHIPPPTKLSPYLQSDRFPYLTVEKKYNKNKTLPKWRLTVTQTYLRYSMCQLLFVFLCHLLFFLLKMPLVLPYKPAMSILTVLRTEKISMYSTEPNYSHLLEKRNKQTGKGKS